MLRAMKQRHESGHWHPERWRNNPVRVRRYLRHLDRAAHTAMRELAGFHEANLLHGALRAHRDGVESERILHELGIATLRDSC
jgi:hypothetical protein